MWLCDQYHFRMRIYTAPFTEDELVSDAYPLTQDPEHGAIRFEGRYMEVEDGDDESTQKVTVIDIVYNTNLQKNEIKKAAFGAWAKSFMPRRRAQLQEQDPDKVPVFMDEAKKFVGWVLATFDEWDFYMGQSCDPDDMMIFCKHNEAGDIPYFYLIPSAVNSEKC